MFAPKLLKDSGLMHVEISDVGVCIQSEIGEEIFLSNEILDAIIDARIAARSKIEAYRIYGEDADSSERMFTIVDATSPDEALSKAKRLGLSLGFATVTKAVLWKS